MRLVRRDWVKQCIHNYLLRCLI